jgi:hypothetical protein
MTFLIIKWKEASLEASFFVLQGEFIQCQTVCLPRRPIQAQYNRAH